MDGLRLWGCCIAPDAAGCPRRRTNGTQGVSRLPTITLMQADEVRRPFHRDGWIYEEKYDGWRMVAYKEGTAVRLVSRAGKEHSRRFVELAAAIRALPPATLILDGEVAIFDDQLISRFEWFRKRPEDVASTPPIYMAFDCLYLEWRDLRQLPLPQRRAAPDARPRTGSEGGGGEAGAAT